MDFCHFATSVWIKILLAEAPERVICRKQNRIRPGNEHTWQLCFSNELLLFLAVWNVGQ